MDNILAKYRKIIVGVLLILIYFTLLTLISFSRSTEIKVLSENLVNNQDFLATGPKEGNAWVDDTGLHIRDVESGAKVFSNAISLRDIQQLQVSFKVECPEDFGGEATLHVDLFADGYDTDEQEFTVSLRAGTNEISGTIDKGDNAPEEAQLRIFCLDAVECDISNLGVLAVKEIPHGGKNSCVILAAGLFAILVVVTISGMSPMQKSALLNALKKVRPVERIIYMQCIPTAGCISRKRTNDKYYIAIILLLAMEGIFFRSVLGNDLLFGDAGDGWFCNLLAEHWYRFFSGKESFGDLRIFFPTEKTLAFSDCMLGFGIPYSVLRILGTNMYSAFKWLMIGCHCYGSISLLHFLHKNLKLNVVSSLVGVVIFSFSNSYQIMVGHPQLFALSLIPGFLIVTFKFFENLRKIRARRIYGVCCILYLEYLLYTSYYPIFFLIFFLLLFTIITQVVFVRRKINLLRQVAQYINSNYWEVLGYLALGAGLALPFLGLYLSAMASFGDRAWSEVNSMLPTLVGFINVSNRNLLYGNIFSDFFPGETTCGFPFITFLLLLLSIIHYYNQYIRSKVLQRQDAASLSVQGKLNIQAALSLTILVLMMLLIADGRYSLWYIIYSIIPGASAIRAVSRYLMFLCLPVGILLAWFGNDFCINRNRRHKTAVFILMAILFIENMTNLSLGAWNSSDRINFLKDIPVPPEDCEIMYVLPNEATQASWWVDQLDAWEIANKYDLKTVNGYSGQFPDEWELWEEFTAQYITNVDQWCRSNGINSGVYAFNKTEGIWVSYTDMTQYTLGNEIYFDGTSADAHRYFIEGMSGTEDGFAWTLGNQTRFFATISTQTESDLLLQVNLRMIFNAPQRLIVTHEDQVLFDESIESVDNPITIHIPAEYVQDQVVDLIFQIPEAISPEALEMSGDKRDLAFAIESFLIKENL